MPRRWWILGDGMEEVAFKRVPEGWLFTAPAVWPRRATYLVSDAQKEALARRLRWMWRVSFLIIFALTSVLAPLTAEARPTVRWGAVGAMALAVLAFGALYRRVALAPLIENLAPTRARITRRDAFLTQAATYSTGAIVTLGLTGVVLLAASLYHGLAEAWDWTAILGTLLFGFTAAYFAALLWAKRRMG